MTTSASTRRLADEELRRGIQRALGLRDVTLLSRRPLDDCSSRAIERVTARSGDGGLVELVCKDLGAGGLLDEARARPAFLYDPLREIETYRLLLPRLAAPSVRCLGADIDAADGRYLLFLEPAPGVPLWQCGWQAWPAAARWLGRFQRAAGLPDASAVKAARLLRYDEAYFRQWPRRLSTIGGLPEESLAFLQELAPHYSHVARSLARLPRCLVHGDFFPSNILVHEGENEPGVTPLDWELAGVGPALLDLACLGAGALTSGERTTLRHAYLETSGGVPDSLGPSDLDEALALCRLHVAVQFLTWSADWRLPAHQRTDWLACAREAAREVGL